MTADAFKRKLTAILSADVEGYSRLMGEDEAGTVQTLTTYRGLMSTTIEQNRGRVIDSPGNNLLREKIIPAKYIEKRVGPSRFVVMKAEH